MRYSMIAASILFNVDIKDYFGFAISKAIQQVVIDRLKERIK